MRRLTTMKKKLYFKQWVQDILLISELVLAMGIGSIVDTIGAPIEALIVPGLLMIVIALLLMKYGRFEEKEDEE